MRPFEVGGLAVLLFASTNVDDLFLLLALFGDARLRTRQIVLGQSLGIGALIITSLMVAWGAIVLPRPWISWLGLLPLLLGLKGLLDLKRPVIPEDRGQLLAGTLASRRVTLAIAGVTIANGADNVSAYAPVFAVLHGSELGLMIAIFVCLIGVWCYGAHWLARAAPASMRREPAFRFVTPVVLVVLGLWILAGLIRNQPP